RINGTLALSAATIFDVANGAAAQDLIVAATLTGASTLDKRGAGTLVLSGSSASYTGSVLANDGLLLVNGSQSASAVTVGRGTLGGNGTVGAVTSSGIVSPGENGPAILTVSGDLNLGGAFVVDINGATAGPAGYDQLRVIGGVNLN